MWFFSNDIPYTGSIRYLIDSDGRILYGHGCRAEKEDRWRWQLGEYGMIQFRYTAEDGSVAGVDTSSDLPGINYRHFDWSMDPWPWWTIRFSLVYPILFFGCLPAVRLIRTIKGRIG